MGIVQASESTLIEPRHFSPRFCKETQLTIDSPLTDHNAKIT